MERLKHVDPQDRVFVYDAGIILEFLRDTYVNPRQFLLLKNVPSEISFEIMKFHFAIPGDHDGRAVARQEMYDEYVKWRFNKNYTTPVEKPYRFFLLLGKMKFAINGWQFKRLRKGISQMVYFTPVVKRFGHEDRGILDHSEIVEAVVTKFTEILTEDIDGNEYDETIVTQSEA